MSFFSSPLRFCLVVAGTAGIIFEFVFPAARAVANEPSTLPAVVVDAKSEQFNWAKLAVGAHIIFISSGPKTLATRLIDANTKTLFRFSDSDRRPVAIVELRQAQLLRRVSVYSGPNTARFDVFLLQKMPRDPADLEYVTPLAVVDPVEPGNATVEIAPTTARYLAVRWTRRDVGSPLEVAEIGAFSLEPTGLTDTTLPWAESGPQMTGPPLVGPVSPL